MTETTAEAAPAERQDRCRVCDDPIEACELCARCAEGNDPFPEAGWWSDMR